MTDEPHTNRTASGVGSDSRGQRVRADGGRATTWAQFREELDGLAAEYRANDWTVETATADHGAVERPETADEPVRFLFTVGDGTADTLERRADGRSFADTELRYADTDTHRLYLLAVRDPDGVVILLAGGVAHDALRAVADEVGTDHRARTVVRRLDGHRAVVFAHDRVEPFVAEL